LENEFYDLPRESSSEMALKKDHPPLTKPSEWAEPLKNKIIYVNTEFRVLEERLDPGDTRRFFGIIVFSNLMNLYNRNK